MLLRGSGEHDGTRYELNDIVARSDGADCGSRVPGAGVLNGYADAFFGADPGALRTARERVGRELGAEAVADAAGIIGIFNAVVRVADATGIPLEQFKAEASHALRADLGIDAWGPREAP